MIVTPPLDEVEHVGDPEHAVGEEELGHDDVLYLPVERLKHLKYYTTATILKLLMRFVRMDKDRKTTRSNAMTEN